MITYYYRLNHFSIEESFFFVGTKSIVLDGGNELKEQQSLGNMSLLLPDKEMRPNYFLTKHVNFL